jgi:phage terminase large subunit-like protein
MTTTLERPLAGSPAMEALELPTKIDLHFSTADEVHDGLDKAVAALIASAGKDATCGILVTRLNPGRYTVALDDSVPFGETYENIAA